MISKHDGLFYKSRLKWKGVKTKFLFYDHVLKSENGNILVATILTQGMKYYNFDELMISIKYTDREALKNTLALLLHLLAKIKDNLLVSGRKIFETDYLILSEPNNPYFLKKFYGVMFLRQSSITGMKYPRKSTPFLHVIGFTEKEFNVVIRNSSTYRLQLILGEVFSYFPSIPYNDLSEEFFKIRSFKMDKISQCLQYKTYKKNDTEDEDLFFRNAFQIKLPYSSTIRLVENQSVLKFEISTRNAKFLENAVKKFTYENSVRSTREKYDSVIFYVTGVAQVIESAFSLDSFGKCKICDIDENGRNNIGGVFLVVRNLDEYYRMNTFSKDSYEKYLKSLGPDGYWKCVHKYDGFVMQFFETQEWKNFFNLFLSDDRTNKKFRNIGRKFSKTKETQMTLDIIDVDAEEDEDEDEGEEENMKNDSVSSFEVDFRRPQFYVSSEFPNCSKISSKGRGKNKKKERNEKRISEKVIFYPWESDKDLKRGLRNYVFYPNLNRISTEDFLVFEEYVYTTVFEYLENKEEMEDEENGRKKNIVTAFFSMEESFEDKTEEIGFPLVLQFIISPEGSVVSSIPESIEKYDKVWKHEISKETKAFHYDKRKRKLQKKSKEREKRIKKQIIEGLNKNMKDVVKKIEIKKTKSKSLLLIAFGK